MSYYTYVTSCANLKFIVQLFSLGISSSPISSSRKKSFRSCRRQSRWKNIGERRKIWWRVSYLQNHSSYYIVVVMPLNTSLFKPHHERYGDGACPYRCIKFISRAKYCFSRYSGCSYHFDWCRVRTCNEQG